MKRLFAVFGIIALWSAPTSAQDLSRALSDVGEAYAEAYVDPLLRALGTDLNAGLLGVPLSRGKVNGIDLYFGLKINGTSISESERSFDLTYADRVLFETYIDGEHIRLSVPASVSVRDAPTVFGSSTAGSAIVRVQHDTTVTFQGTPRPVSVDTSYTIETIGGLTELSIAPLPVPHLEVGTFMGTSLMVRWLPKIGIMDIGSVGLAGFGIRHDVSQYLPASPIDIAVQAMWQSLRVADSEDGDVLNASTSSFALSAGKRLGPLSLYGGLQMNSANIDITYRHTLRADDFSENLEVAFSNKRSGQVQGVIGGGLHAGPLVLSADIGLGANTVYGVSLGVLL